MSAARAGTRPPRGDGGGGAAREDACKRLRAAVPLTSPRDELVGRRDRDKARRERIKHCAGFKSYSLWYIYSISIVS